MWILLYIWKFQLSWYHEIHKHAWCLQVHAWWLTDRQKAEPPVFRILRYGTQKRSDICINNKRRYIMLTIILQSILSCTLYFIHKRSRSIIFNSFYYFSFASGLNSISSNKGYYYYTLKGCLRPLKVTGCKPFAGQNRNRYN